MAIPIPKSEERGIGRDVGGVQNVSSGAKSVSDALGRLGQAGHEMGVQMLRERKRAQTNRFKLESQQEYQIERQNKMQELALKYDGTDGTVDGQTYYEEMASWSAEKLDNLRAIAPTQEANDEFSQLIVNDETNTLVSADTQQFNLEVTAAKKSVTDGYFKAAEAIKANLGPSLGFAEDQHNIQLRKINDLLAQGAISPKMAEEMEKAGGRDVAWSLGQEAARKLDIEELSNLVGIDFFTKDGKPTSHAFKFMKEFAKEDRPAVERMLQQMQKGRHARISPLAKYLNQQEKENLIRDALSKMKVKDESLKNDIRLRVKNMNAALKSSGGWLNPTLQRENGLLWRDILSMPDDTFSPREKGEFMGQLANSMSFAKVKASLIRKPKIEGEVSVKHMDAQIKNTVDQMKTDNPLFAASMKEQSFAKAFENSLKNSLKTEFESMWKDLDADSATGIYDHDPRIKREWDTWFKAVADGAPQEQAQALFFNALNSTRTREKELGIAADKQTGIPIRVASHFKGLINNALKGKNAQAALGVIDTISSVSDFVGMGDDTERLLWDRLVKLDPQDDFTNQIRFISQMPADDNMSRLQLMRNMIPENKNNLEATLSRVTSKQLKIDDFREQIAGHPAWIALESSMLVGDTGTDDPTLAGNTNQGYLNSLSEALTMELVRQALTDKGMSENNRFENETEFNFFSANTAKGVKAKPLSIYDVVKPQHINNVMNTFIRKHFTELNDNNNKLAIPNKEFDVVQEFFPNTDLGKVQGFKDIHIASAIDTWRDDLINHADIKKVVVPKEFEQAMTAAQRKMFAFGGARGVGEIVFTKSSQEVMRDFFANCTFVNNGQQGVKVLYNGNPVLVKDHTDPQGQRKIPLTVGFTELIGSREAMSRTNRTLAEMGDNRFFISKIFNPLPGEEQREKDLERTKDFLGAGERLQKKRAHRDAVKLKENLETTATRLED